MGHWTGLQETREDAPNQQGLTQIPNTGDTWLQELHSKFALEILRSTLMTLNHVVMERSVKD